MGLHQSKQKNKSAQLAVPTFSQHFPTQLDPIYYGADDLGIHFLRFITMNGNQISMLINTRTMNIMNWLNNIIFHYLPLHRMSVVVRFLEEEERKFKDSNS